MKKFDCGDVLVVGAGLAGLFASLKLSPLKVSLLSVAPLCDGASSYWAQGGIAAALSDGDTAESHAHDTMVAGCFLNNPEAVKIITQEARQRIYELFSYGIEFDRDSTGAFIQGREAAHSANRIVKVGGDGAGKKIIQNLANLVQKSEHITIYEPYVIFDLAKDETGRIVGIFARKIGESDPILFTATHIVLATGGIGWLYADTTNPHQIRGESLGIAYRHGITIKDAEFVQFHPTALDVGLDPCPLATEALRGEGCILKNELSESFMEKIHPDKDLAPRDIVARNVAYQRHIGHKTYLDTRDALGNKIFSEFPAVSNYAKQAGLNPLNDMIPIKPAQHYHMGGIATDSYGRTSEVGLYVIGEAACTGAHGANRLASNSLLEAVVFAGRMAEYIKSSSLQKKDSSDILNIIKVDRNLGKKFLPKLREIMSDYVGIIRTNEGLSSAKKRIIELKELSQGTAPFINYAYAALAIIDAALERKESVGAHFMMEEETI